MTVADRTITSDFFSIRGQGSVSGAPTSYTIDWSFFNGFEQEMANEITLHGVAVYVHAPAADIQFLTIRAGDIVTIPLEYHTMDATTQWAKAFYPLDIKVIRSTHEFIALQVTAAAAGNLYWVSAWGTFKKFLGEPLPAPVSLEGYKWPLVRR